MTSYTPEQFARLPKWAQALIRKAERDIAYAKGVQEEVAKNAGDAAMLALDPVGTERMSWRGKVVAFRDFYDAAPVPVGRELDTISMQLTDDSHDYINVEVREGWLHISGNGAMVARFHSSNILNITLDDLHGTVAK